LWASLTMKNLTLIVLFCLNFSLLAQDSLKVMYHNILKFPSATPDRVDSLRIILQYAKPDVYVVQELQTESGADLILNEGLNAYGASNYQRAQFIDGYDTDNCLFYNSDKLGLISQQQIGTALRDISTYVLYYKSPNLSAQTDTIYLHFFSCHLKAGSSDFNQRNQEALQIKYYLNDIAASVENIFVGGDFNFYSGFESGCQSLMNSGSIPLFDPLSMVGNWSNDITYASVHTQSTRMNPLSDGSGGGLDDRFDMILVSEDVFNNENGVSYISGSYGALGQDGNRFNGSVLTPTNSSVPDSVSNALYYASDHLPVFMSIVFDETASIVKETNTYLKVFYDNQSETIKILNSFDQQEFKLFDSSGRLVLSGKDKGFIPCNLEPGVYVWQVMAEGKSYSDRIVIQ
jgi:hypothetical protein